MEAKKGRMSRVYTKPGQKASPEKVKAGAKQQEKGMERRVKTPRMGG